MNSELMMKQRREIRERALDALATCEADWEKDDRKPSAYWVGYLRYALKDIVRELGEEG